MTPVTREFRDEVLAVLLCWWMMDSGEGYEWAGLAAEAMGGTAPYARADYEANIRTADLRGSAERAIATVERWPVLP